LDADRDFLIETEDNLFKLSEDLNTDDPNILFKRVGIGLCPKGFALVSDFNELISLVMKCIGGMSGTELIQLPEAGGILDQPSVFLRAYEVISEEIARHLDAIRKQHTDVSQTSGRRV